jgi:hypothetical protein
LLFIFLHNLFSTKTFLEWKKGESETNNTLVPPVYARKLCLSLQLECNCLRVRKNSKTTRQGQQQAKAKSFVKNCEVLLQFNQFHFVKLRLFDTLQRYSTPIKKLPKVDKSYWRKRVCVLFLFYNSCWFLSLSTNFIDPGRQFLTDR